MTEPGRLGISLDIANPPTSALDRLLTPGIFGTSLVLLSAALCCWYLPYELPSPDAGAVLTQAMKIARGAVYYRDVDSYPFPAAPYLLAAAMRVFGEHLVVARALAAGAYTGVVMAGYLTTLALAGRGAAALCGLWLLAWKFIAHPAFHDALYPDVALCFAMWSVVCFVWFRSSGRRSTVVAAGLLVALALLSKQNLGIYLGAAMGGLLLLVARPQRDSAANDAAGRLADVAAFGAGAALPLATAAIYFQSHGVLGQALYSGLVRPFSGYLPTSSLSFLVPLQWWNLGDLRGQDGFAYAIVPLFHMLTGGKLPLPDAYPVFWMAAEAAARLLYTAVPVVFAAAFVGALRSRREGAADLTCLAVMSFAVFASAFPRADFYHVAGVYPALLVLAFAAGSSLLAGAGSPRMAAAATRIAAGGTLGVALLSVLLAGWYFRGLTQLAGNDRGRVWIPPEYAWIDDVIRYLDDNLEEDEAFFVYGHEAYYYFFSGHTAPWPFVQLYPGMTGDDGAAAMAASIGLASPPIVVRGILAGWPGLEPVENYAADLKTFLERDYEATIEPFSDGRGPDAPAPPGWLCTVMKKGSSRLGAGDLTDGIDENR